MKSRLDQPLQVAHHLQNVFRLDPEFSIRSVVPVPMANLPLKSLSLRKRMQFEWARFASHSESQLVDNYYKKFDTEATFVVVRKTFGFARMVPA